MFFKSCYTDPRSSDALDWSTFIGFTHTSRWTQSIRQDEYIANIGRVFLSFVWWISAGQGLQEDLFHLFFQVIKYLSISKSTRETYLPWNCDLLVQIKTQVLKTPSSFPSTRFLITKHISPHFVLQPSSFPWLRAVEQIQHFPPSDCRKGFSSTLSKAQLWGLCLQGASPCLFWDSPVLSKHDSLPVSTTVLSWFGKHIMPL